MSHSDTSTNAGNYANEYRWCWISCGGKWARWSACGDTNRKRVPIKGERSERPRTAWTTAIHSAVKSRGNYTDGYANEPADPPMEVGPWRHRFLELTHEPPAPRPPDDVTMPTDRQTETHTHTPEWCRTWGPRSWRWADRKSGCRSPNWGRTDTRSACGPELTSQWIATARCCTAIIKDAHH